MVLIREVYMYGNVLFSQQPVTFLMNVSKLSVSPAKGSASIFSRMFVFFPIYTPHCYDALRYWPYYKVV